MLPAAGRGMQQLYGHAFGTTWGTYAELLGTKSEDPKQHEKALLGVYRSPTPRYIWCP